MHVCTQALHTLYFVDVETETVTSMPRTRQICLLLEAERLIGTHFRAGSSTTIKH
jgi:hypothetical protein